ncbi:site-specific integrase [Limnofasciculus baicalensis]|uniref:Site-specific integrase n=1 Tax=Limnofasciculus baicalensis BBK-W-15 TaxID=2699891 RepID=A0AAE3GRB7_9CYAN|nr:site-specific integrase [Limnofasciculus baicalensis]MCP2728829.1 site-specific integrase [Limnofasciculus baicalensis BBK-W-15]
MRRRKGSVSVESLQGRLRLRLPRHVFSGEQKHLTLGLPDTSDNRKIAEAKAKLIESDIALERFDSTLVKYQPPSYLPKENKQKHEPTLLEIWLQYTVFKSKTLADSTIKRGFGRTERQLIAMPFKKPSEARNIRRFLLENLTLDSSFRALTHLSACCSWAVGEGFLDHNPFDALPKPSKPSKRQTINPFTREERNLIIQAFSLDTYYCYYTPFVKFLFWTGCRTSEAIGLQWKHVDAAMTTITFAEAVVDKSRKDTKTHCIRKFPVNEALTGLLQSQLPNDWLGDDLVFPSKKGLTIDPHNFLNKAWKTVLGKLPIPYRPQYNTRHTFISLCLENGVNVVQIANWVGNSPDVIWKNYAGLVSTIKVPEP